MPRMTDKLKPSFILGLRLAVTAVVLIGLFWLAGAAIRPSLPSDSKTVTEQDIRNGEEVRKHDLSEEHRFDPNTVVDYSEGKNAKWYPKGESPLLAELVGNGELPPVAERVGPEPVVYRGLDGIGKYGGTWVRIITNDNAVRGLLMYECGMNTIQRRNPYGDKLHPFLAKEITASDNNKIYTVRLRKIRWSDGHPFTGVDVLFWCK